MEGLQGIEGLEADLARDLFQVRYNPARVGVEAMLAAIEREGFKGRVVPAPASLRPEGLKLDVATLPADLKQLFADAAAQDRRVLVDIHGPG